MKAKDGLYNAGKKKENSEWSKIISIVILQLVVKYATKEDSSHIKIKQSERREEYCILSNSYHSISFVMLLMPTRWQDVIIVPYLRKQSREIS